MKSSVYIALLCALLGALFACSALAPLLPPTPMPTVTPSPTPEPTPTLPPSPTPEPPDTGWLIVTPGMEMRRLLVSTELGTERVTVARLDASAFRIRVHYTPGEAQVVSAWAQQTGALLTLNAGYFAEGYEVTGLTVVEGRSHGVPYGDYAGMFAVAPGEYVSVRWLRQRPYIPEETLVAGVQSFPVVVKPGGVMGFPEDGDDGRTARRTVVAQDRSGRILFVLTSQGYFSLHTLAVWLVESDLDVDIALNLDGGTSSGLWLVDAPYPAKIDSYVPVPSVISVYPRE